MPASEEAKEIIGKLYDLSIEDIILLRDVIVSIASSQDKVSGSAIIQPDSSLRSVALEVLEGEECFLRGPESSLIAAWLLTNDQIGVPWFARAISRILSPNRKIANVSATLSSLVKRELIEVVQPEMEAGRHRRYLLTEIGKANAEALIRKKS